MGTRKAKKGSILQSADKIKDTVKNLHDEALEVSDNLVNASLSTGAKWQKISAKALKGGTVLFEKQQDLVLSTLEELKGQYAYGAKRFSRLFDLKMVKAVKAKRVGKRVKANIDEVLKSTSKTKRTTASYKTDAAKDDLKVIDGVGPKIESLINEAGITTFERLAAADVKELKALLENAGPGFKFHNPANWKKQAEEILAKA